MKIGVYITAEDWNALGREKQLALRDGLRFMGHACNDYCFPEVALDKHMCAYLYRDGDLLPRIIYVMGNGDTRITIPEILAFIELTSFEVSK